jgi:NAD(P)-dependent dehydrogenase (short-subunit alcohol dehydrogenase family)
LEPGFRAPFGFEHPYATKPMRDDDPKEAGTKSPLPRPNGAIANFTADLAQRLAKQGFASTASRSAIWTPLIPSTVRGKTVAKFGKKTLLEPSGQPAEMVPASVLLASNDGSYITGAMIPRPAAARCREVDATCPCPS